VILYARSKKFRLTRAIETAYMKVERISFHDAENFGIKFQNWHKASGALTCLDLCYPEWAMNESPRDKAICNRSSRDI